MGSQVQILPLAPCIYGSDNMRNRKIKFEERPTNMRVGNNNHWSRVKKIKEYLSQCEDNESDFKSIWLWLNENTRQGVLSNALANILGKNKCFTKPLNFIRLELPFR